MVNPKRTRAINTKPIGSGPVVYWMSRDCRVHDNWALLYAQEKARELKRPLIVVYNAVIGFLGGGMRQWDFKMRGIKEVSEILAEYHIPFFLLLDETGKESDTLLADFMVIHQPGLIVTDFSPVRSMNTWVESLAHTASISVVQVDAHNIVPCWVASTKQEFGAYTLRPKLHALLPVFLEEFPKLVRETIVYARPPKTISWKTILSHPQVHTSVPVVSWITPGEKAAQIHMKHFIETKLIEYADKRNDPTEQGQSDLSPYMHYGHIAPQRVALSVVQASGVTITELLTMENSYAVFLEELIVRRELADNFCFYNPHYDSPQGFPDWAKKTIQKTKTDRREYLYTKKQFEAAETHDELWNAAQRQMVVSGKMHGYMRMYWAKKILEWTKSAEEAMDIAIYLNDMYELDGRDPNGYAGIAWSIGGVHDRAWFERPVFGQIRYMNSNGCKKKFDVKTYREKWLGGGELV